MGLPLFSPFARGAAWKRLEAQRGLHYSSLPYRGACQGVGKGVMSDKRRLIFDHLVEATAPTLRRRFEALAGALCDLLAQRWLLTGQTYDHKNPEQVY
jgi:hypothetical protein